GYLIYEGGVDITPPVTTCQLEGLMTGDEYYDEVTVTLTAIDDLSGVNYTMYRIDDGSYTEYGGPFVVSSLGNHTVYFYSVDMAGNIEDEKTCSFTIICPIEIEIQSGLGFKVTVRNIIDKPLYNLSWLIDLDGGLVILGKHSSGEIDEIAAGASTQISSGLIIGIGRTTIRFEVECAKAEVNVFLLLFFIIIPPLSR
ncbi:MAG: hypothetical protein KKC68_04440, partial [Candidatus Thermoplasmatota archaeon]|nr:hypothetical protein [Candidatus Thermoplasmatota archaeon]